MKFEGSVTIEAERDGVWQFLTDPHGVSQCAPGLESLEVLVPDQRFRVVAAVGLGSIKARFDTQVDWEELDPPHRATMKAHGNAPGSTVDATATMVLVDLENGTTQLNWEADVVIMGTIASLASRLMGSVTKKLTGEFFACVKSKIEA